MPAATTSMLTFLPPPTTNTLDPSQRARLLKSTRKLENLLGATPHVLESDSLTLNPSAMTSTGHHEDPNDQHIYISPCGVSSNASLTDSSESHELLSTCTQNGTTKIHGKWKSIHLRTLVLRLRKVPSVPFLNNGKKQLSPTSSSSVGSSYDCTKMPTLHPPVNTMEPPPSPLFSTEHDPAWPTAKPSQGKIRLKRMGKLIRTLGENIPPELVFRQKRSQASDKNPKNERSDSCSSEEPTSTSAHDALKAQFQESNGLLESLEPQPNVFQKRWRRSASIGSLLTRAVAPNANKSTDAQKLSSVPCLLRSVTTVRCQDIRRNDQSEWDGEWSIKDSEKRAKALRNLKC